MPYEIKEETKTVYIVDYEEFANRQDAELKALSMNLADKFYNQFTGLSDALMKDPNALVQLVEEFRDGRLEIINPKPTPTFTPTLYRSEICEKEFNAEAANSAGYPEGYNLHSWLAMCELVDKLLIRQMKINAIRLVRGCFEPAAGLREAKEWVEDRQAKLRQQGIIH